MAKKIKIHPSITETAYEIYEKIGMHPSTALEEYACFKSTNKEELIIEEKMLRKREKELEKDKKIIEERLEKVRDEIKAIKDLKKSFNPINSKEFEETVHIIKTRLSAIQIQMEQNKWGVKKMPLQDIGKICKERNMPIEAVLDSVPDELKQFIEEYKFY